MNIRLHRFFRPGRVITCSMSIIAGLALVSLSFRDNDPVAPSAATAYTSADSAASRNAFLEAYKVFMSPRCMNCHPAGDVPLQGDDSHLHTQGVKRGLDGKGLFAAKCANCHQRQNTPGLNMPPGVPDWHLPPAAMRMVFQGKSPHDLAVQMKDRRQNGGKSLNDLIAHMNTDLVKWAWSPGDGRTKPPLSYATFRDQFKRWIQTGAVPPEEN